MPAAMMRIHVLESPNISPATRPMTNKGAKRRRGDMLVGQAGFGPRKCPKANCQLPEITRSKSPMTPLFLAISGVPPAVATPEVALGIL